MDGGPPRALTAEALPAFREGIYLVLSRWSALRLAVENEWGGRDSHRKADQLALDIISWFTQSREPLYIDDLENILDEAMLSLNTEAEDGSIEEIAYKLMTMHEECLEGNLQSIERLREASHQDVSDRHVMQVTINRALVLNHHHYQIRIMSFKHHSLLFQPSTFELCLCS
ncbi:hypothetical protein F2P56_023604 [Juglans regia]|uniref:Pre-rRNA-processing protein TSR2 homolog n=1 Tax=Juglans regia TaxID=51240 RepID=A0A833X047_JUGRE|nr:hypothetical protein F2P56_023604 [Juglans regia]